MQGWRSGGGGCAGSVQRRPVISRDRAGHAACNRLAVMIKRSTLAVSCVLGMVGCGGGGDDAGTIDGAIDAPGVTVDAAIDAAPAGCPTTGRYLPLRTGGTWSYRVTDTANGTITSKTQVVGALENIGAIHPGVMAYKLTTTKPGGTTDSWQEDVGTGVRRHAENDLSGATQTSERYDPYRTRVDEAAAHLTTGAQWTESYTELVTVTGMPTTTTAKTERWTVVAAEENVTVPAGTYCALHLRRVSTVGGAPGSDKEYWFARGVGKIKESGAGQIEELTAATP